MGGDNPYLKTQAAKPATKPFKVTFMPMDVTIDVDPKEFPYDHEGLPGSLLDISRKVAIGIDHACGGVCACSTCHVVVKEGFDSLSEASEEEDDQLENAPSIKPTSRLACQAVPDGSCDLVVEVPEWNRNLAKEPEH